VIRALLEGDAEELAALQTANRSFLAPFMPDRSESFFTPDGQREWLCRSATEGGWRFAILDRQAICGMVSLLHPIRGPLQSATIGYWVAQTRQRRGLATAAVAELLDFAFGEAGLHRVQAGTLLENIASQRVLEKNSFERIGIAHRYLLLAGAWRDHLLFQRLAD
jgi:ribosomal-protein-alanine N-acetyltransferase